MEKDTIDIMKKCHKFSIRSLEKILKYDKMEFNGMEEIKKVGLLVDIIKDCEKMKALYGEDKEGD